MVASLMVVFDKQGPLPTLICKEKSSRKIINVGLCIWRKPYQTYQTGMVSVYSRLYKPITKVKKAVSGSNLSSVLDASAGEWPSFVAKRLADLGLHCCESNTRDRPVVSPVLVKELEQLSLIEDRRVPSFFICPITKEIMHDPQLAGDGYTYEGEAMFEWLKNGRETSLMTNLTLSHLELIPNHSIQVAIQDWLCNP